MGFTSLPEYVAIQRTSSTGPRKCDRVCSPRVTRIAVELLVLSAIGGLVLELQRIHTALQSPPSPAPAQRSRPPLNFKLIQERYGLVHEGATREEVEELLGPPTRPNFAPFNPRRPHWVWDGWSDPKDKGKWVIVLYAEGKVVIKQMNGF
jgi:hypothetical protein